MATLILVILTAAPMAAVGGWLILREIDAARQDLEWDGADPLLLSAQDRGRPRPR